MRTASSSQVCVNVGKGNRRTAKERDRKRSACGERGVWLVGPKELARNSLNLTYLAADLRRLRLRGWLCCET